MKEPEFRLRVLGLTLNLSNLLSLFLLMLSREGGRSQEFYRDMRILYGITVDPMKDSKGTFLRNSQLRTCNNLKIKP